MNLNTVVEVKRPASADEITEWRDSYAWLAGGTWLFSEPQVTTDTLIDLDRLAWPALTPSQAGLEIAATCRIAELHAFQGPAEWTASTPRARTTRSRTRSSGCSRGSCSATRPQSTREG